MNRFSLARLDLGRPVTITLSNGRVRPGLSSAQGIERTITELNCCFTLNSLTRTIHAEMHPIPRPLLIYGPADFSAAAADTPEQHIERVRSILGSDPTAVLQALADGNPLPLPPPRVPAEIANWRAKAVLAQMGLLAAVEQAIEAIPEPTKTVVVLAWNGDAKLARNGPTVLSLAQTLGMSPAQIDDLFIAAEAIQI